jgi:hypothetical protein
MTRHSEVVYPAQFAPLIAEIVITWGALEVEMDVLRAILMAQPECAAIAPVPEKTRFLQRARQFDDLCGAYFAPYPAMVTACSKLYNDAIKLQEDRNYVTHGRYGFGITNNVITEILISSVKNDILIFKKYTHTEFQDLADKIGSSLSYFRFMCVGFPWHLNPKILQSRWKIPTSQVAGVQTLIDRIRNCYHSTTQQLLSQSTGLT